MRSEDVEVLKRIEKWCREVKKTQCYFGDQLTLETNTIYQNAIAFCILKLAEEVGGLSEEYKESSDFQWEHVEEFAAAMHTDKIDGDDLWHFVTKDVELLSRFLELASGSGELKNAV